VRARLVPTARWVQGPEAAASALRDPAHDPAQTVLLEGATAPTGTSAGGAGEIKLLAQDDPGRVELQVSSPAGGWVVLHDTWYPGWRAEVDGQEAELYIGDGLFRAVWAPAGNHSIVFRFAPRSFIAGAAISSIAWFGLLFCAWRWRMWKTNAVV
jgi:hypothetical protein